MKFLIRILATAFVAYGLSTTTSWVKIDDVQTALLFAGVLALLNMFVKPILIILTLPITILSLGFFLLIINTIMVVLADRLIEKIHITSYLHAFLFAVVLSLLSSILVGLLGGLGSGKSSD